MRALQLYERIVTLGISIVVLLALLFVAGNYQDFSDTTQEALLAAMQILSGVVLVAALLSLAGEIAGLLVIRRWGRLVMVAWLVIVVVVSTSVLVGSTGVLVLQRPV